MGDKPIIPDTRDYFSFYQLEQKFDIDSAHLKQLFLDKSKAYHPDFFLGDAEAQNIAVSTTAYNNLAYKTLNSDVSRASYLLELKIQNDDKQVALPQVFLMDMMELNEALDELNDDNRNAFEDQIHALKNTTLDAIKSTARSEAWTDLQMEILKWRYLERIENRLMDI